MTMCVEAIGRAGGRYIALENYQEEVCNRKTVKRELVLGLTFTGKGLELGGPYAREPEPELGEWAVECFEGLQKLVDQGKIVPHPIRVFKGGFADMIKGLDMLRRREVSAEKLVVSLVD